MRRLRTRPVYPMLLPLFYVLHTARVYFGNVTVGNAVSVWLLYTAIAGALWILARFFLKRPSGAALMALLSMVLFIYWAEIIAAFNKLSGLNNFTHLPLVLLSGLAIAYIAARLPDRASPATRQRFTLLLNLFFVLNIFIEGAWCAARHAVHYRTPVLARTITPEQSHTVQRGGPDVYLLLFDEYTSNPALKALWSYDNDSVARLLAARGFALRPASRANYHYTFFSVASMLNMEYLEPSLERRDVGDAVPDCLRELANSKVVAQFESAGYTFYNNSIFRIGNQPKPYLRDLVVDGNDVLRIHDLAHVAAREYLPYLRHRRAIRTEADYHDPELYAYDDFNKHTVAHVCSLSSAPRVAPRFVYAHLLLPHAPFYYDSMGHYLPPAVTRATQQQHPIDLYEYAIRRANREMLRMVDTILQSSGSNAVILIAGDHGYRTPEAEHSGRDALFQNFLAVHYGDGDYSALPDSVTNVNLFRGVLNKVLGTHYPMLPNRCVVLHGGGH